ncbi:hypothetical protein TIFTF001_016437 [Ficus carica]|uniref:Uncharacterized protein n=1 Tax=Ficus carica TaxID=3494 RepID=A0AA88A8W0_FICCA|nr:hypothetical protein TIFTF001_016437 [Ficus carica]
MQEHLKLTVVYCHVHPTGSYTRLVSETRSFTALLMANGGSSSNPPLGVKPDIQALWSMIFALDLKIDAKNDALAVDVRQILTLLEQHLCITPRPQIPTQPTREFATPPPPFAMRDRRRDQIRPIETPEQFDRSNHRQSSYCQPPPPLSMEKSKYFPSLSTTVPNPTATSNET